MRAFSTELLGEHLCQQWSARLGCPPWFHEMDVSSYRQIKLRAGNRWQQVVLEASELIKKKKCL